jgi:penicillin V acylase-like amidase (Ntn superfamily)
MRSAKSVWVTALVLGFVSLIPPSARACTIFSYSQGGCVLVGNNEDVPFLPQAAMWFLPASTNGYGRVCFGWNSSAQGGMNDQGLFIDWAVTPDSETRAWKRALAWIRLGIDWVTTSKNSPPVKFAKNDSQTLNLPLYENSSELLLANCATVDEAIAFAKRFKYPGNPVPGNPCHCLIADRSGESIVCEIRKLSMHTV